MRHTPYWQRRSDGSSLGSRWTRRRKPTSSGLGDASLHPVDSETQANIQWTRRHLADSESETRLAMSSTHSRSNEASPKYPASLILALACPLRVPPSAVNPSHIIVRVTSLSRMNPRFACPRTGGRGAGNDQGLRSARKGLEEGTRRRAGEGGGRGEGRGAAAKRHWQRGWPRHQGQR
jgi:hypothetical protein